MIYQTTSASQVTAALSEVLSGSKGQNGERLVINGLKLRDVSANFHSMIPISVRAEYQDNNATGVYTSGSFDSENQIVCVSGLDTCAAFIAVRGNTAGKNLGSFLAIHVGGDEKGIEHYFHSIITGWRDATVNDGTLWVVGGSFATYSSSVSNSGASWTERTMTCLGLTNDNNLLYYHPAHSIGLRQNGDVGEPLDAPSPPKKGGCCIIV